MPCSSDNRIPDVEARFQIRQNHFEFAKEKAPKPTYPSKLQYDCVAHPPEKTKREDFEQEKNGSRALLRYTILAL
jgi:hypothetical protein